MTRLRHHWNLFAMILLITVSSLFGCAPDPGAAAGETIQNSSVNHSEKSDRGDFSGLTVRFLDVGQADSALLSCDGYQILIDGGNRDDSRYIYSTIQSLGIQTLDLVVGTHADEDHIGGLAAALYAAEAKEVLCSTTEYSSEAFQNFQSYADLRGNGIRVPEVGETFLFGDLMLEILAVNSGSDSNDSSIVIKATYGTTSFLFTGDAETATEQFLLDHYDVSGEENMLQSTVLKVSHHGSAGATSAEFLQAVNPDYAVISVGAGNSYGHPAQKTLDRLNQERILIYRTDVDGEITVFSDGTELFFATERETQNLPNAAQETDSYEYGNVTYIVNIRSKKFHRPSCESISKMSEENKLYFTGTREEALELDFSPCGTCKP